MSTTPFSVCPGVIILALQLTQFPAHADERGGGNVDSEPVSTKVAVTYYFDTREFNTVNVFTGSKPLPGGFEFWGFTDLHGAQGAGSSRFSLTRHFMEYRLIYPLHPVLIPGIKGFELEAEYNDFNGPDNNLVRVGLTYKHPLPLPWGRRGLLRWRIHPYETDGNGYQASILFAIPLTDRLKITGFADLNVVDNGSNRWVVEPQLTWQINERFFTSLEFRYNGFETENPELDGTGIALGAGLNF